MSADPLAAPKKRVSTSVLLLVYLAFMLFGIVIVAVIWMVADQFLTSSSQNSAMGVVVPMIAAMSMSSFWARREGRPTSGRQWWIALLATLLTLALNGALIWAIASSGAWPELSFRNGFSRDDLVFGSIVGAVLLVLLTLVVRFGFWLGLNGWEKQQAKLAALKTRR
ncbi:ABZJ_00895 family protein [Pseudomonas sp. GX19020]|uniref:ABZJ_00895 family protein n=1 Tax=Pseudomonadota TaxID=1224 RepID=UPI0020189DED|nr:MULTISPECIES: ABZJ_00895 family protein [Pseudomonadota]MCL4066362.1 ABZJ_00895 family protein [Pseudomonas sp. GX19020]